MDPSDSTVAKEDDARLYTDETGWRALDGAKRRSSHDRAYRWHSM